MTKPEPLVIPQHLKLQYYERHLEGRVCRLVTKADLPMMEELILKMAALARQYGGVGIAAPQVGIMIQLAVILYDDNDKADVMINPQITVFGGRDLIEQEGCLSIPPHGKAQARVTRSEIVHLESGTLEDPDAREVTVHKGYNARVIQHEVDHLNGIFFINRVGSISRDLVLRKLSKWVLRARRDAQRAGGMKLGS